MLLRRNDVLWKGLLEDFLPEFLRFFFEEADKLFDFSKKISFLDKELSQIFPEMEMEHPKFIDKLAKVHYCKGEQADWLLIHIEIQGYRQVGFAHRMFVYYYRLKDRYQCPVTSIVIFLERPNKNNVGFFEAKCLGSVVRFEFNAYYVGDQDESELSKSDSLFSFAISTALIAIKYKQDAVRLYKAKMRLLRRLLRAKIDADKRKVLLNFLRLYIRFDNDELNNNFDNNILSLTRKKSETMGVLEQVRELIIQEARERGLKEGVAQGVRKGVAQGVRKGVRKGLKEGIERGRKNEKFIIARQMKQLGISTDIIVKATRLLPDQVQAL